MQVKLPEVPITDKSSMRDVKNYLVALKDAVEDALRRAEEEKTEE